MTVTTPTPKTILSLTDEEVQSVLKTYRLVSTHTAYRHGRESLAGIYGETMDSPNYEAIEDAARARHNDVDFRTAITWAYLAYISPRALGKLEWGLLTSPWGQRHP